MKGKWAKVRCDISVETLKNHMSQEKDIRVYRRLLGIIHLLEGGSRREAQEKAQLSMNVFRTWIIRFNKSGIEGLTSLKPSGRPQKLAPHIRKDLKEKISKGPLSVEGLVHYRLKDLQHYLEREYGIHIGLSGLWCYLNRLKLSWKAGRQPHPQSLSKVQEAFKKISPKMLRSIPENSPDKVKGVASTGSLAQKRGKQVKMRKNINLYELKKD